MSAHCVCALPPILNKNIYVQTFQYCDCIEVTTTMQYAGSVHSVGTLDKGRFTSSAVENG